MRGLVIHATVYVVVNGLLVFTWVMTTGSRTQLDAYTRDIGSAFTPDFWPIVPIVFWGAALVIHAVSVLTKGLSPKRRRKRARRAAARHERTRPEPSYPAAGAGAGRPGGERRERREPQRLQVTVMFTDLCDSTPLTTTLGDDGWAEVLSTHRQTVRECLDEHRGVEVGTQGDGFLVRFDEADDAVACATRLQAQLEEQRGDGSFVPRLRVGIHTGEALENDDDLVGRVVNLAARVVDAAAPDEVLLTEPAADTLRRPVVLRDRGLRSLKGIPAPRHLLEVGWNQRPDDDQIVIIPSSDLGG